MNNLDNKVGLTREVISHNVFAFLGVLSLALAACSGSARAEAIVTNECSDLPPEQSAMVWAAQDLNYFLLFNVFHGDLQLMRNCLEQVTVTQHPFSNNQLGVWGNGDFLNNKSGSIIRPPNVVRTTIRSQLPANK